MNRLNQLIQLPISWIVLSVLLVALPHMQRQPGWISLLLIGLLSWRLLLVFLPRFKPPKFLLFGLIFLSVIGILFHYGTLFGKTAGSAFLLLLVGAKLMEGQQRRDYMLVMALCFFIIVTNFLFSQSIPVLGLMLISLVVMVMALIKITSHEAPVENRQVFALSVRLVAISLPLMLVMFVLFPRIPGPLWNLPNDARGGRTGMSDTMSPGNIANLIQSGDVAFRVDFDGDIPPQNQLYWRGLVLWAFDGRTWERGKTNLNPHPTMEGFGGHVKYTITMEPTDQKWLFILDMPSTVPDGVFYTRDFTLFSKKTIDSLRQYQLASYTHYRIEKRLSRWEREAGLQIPSSSNPKTVALGQQWRANYKTPQDIVKHALQYFHQQPYVYTLQPPLTPGYDPVDQFLFDTRRGFCEHYASSFTLLMRAAGVPARVVVGYQGGTLNPVNQVLTVSQSDAHAWAEVWLEGSGWLRVDPTAAIAPERIEKNLNQALGKEAYRPFYMRMDTGLLRDLKFYWDAMDNRWNEWIIGYGPELQKQFLEMMFNKPMHAADMVLYLMLGLALLTLLVVMWLFKPFAREKQDIMERCYRRFLEKLQSKGIEKYAYEGEQDFCVRASQALPEYRHQIQRVSKLYISWRYRSKSSPRYGEMMKQATRRLKKTT